MSGVAPRLSNVEERLGEMEKDRKEIWKTIQKRILEVDERMTDKAQTTMANVCKFYEDKMKERTRP